VSRSECRLSHRYRISAPTGTVVIHNGTDAPRYRAVPELSPPVVIMVARFAPPKQQELLIRAFRRTSGNARLWLVGDGPGLDRAQARAWGSGKADRILFWGDRADVPELLAQAQIAALISANEGFGLSLIEAMSLGMPVIASDAGAMGEIVAHRNTGLLVPPGDEAQLAAALEKLIADPIERKRMGCAGLARYRAKFSVDRMLAQTFGVYEAVCGSAEIRKPDVCSRCRYPAPCVPTAEALGD
jgi:glycosyltransferase involved in cell wall biosynthesis